MTPAPGIDSARRPSHPCRSGAARRWFSRHGAAGLR